MTSNRQEQLDLRIRRLCEERLYVRPGWRVPVRTVHVPPRPWKLPFVEWLMYPLLGGPNSELKSALSPGPRA